MVPKMQTTSGHEGKASWWSRLFWNLNAFLNCFEFEYTADGTLDVKLVYWCDFGSSVTREEACRFIAASIMKFVVGLCWEVACISRWGYVEKLKQRVMLLKITQLFDMVLEDLATSMEVDASLQATLEAIVALDSENYHAKNRLRVGRVMKVLLADFASMDMAINVATTQVMSSIYYALFGDESRDKPRATLRDLVDPSKSLIDKCQHELCKMLLNFVPDAPYWFLLRCVSCDWDSVDVRLRARGSLLRLGAGL